MGETVNRYRTIFLSDFHLGSLSCKADAILDFLKDNESDQLYLVGDVVDGWALRRKWYWPQEHNDVIQKILRKARKGTRVIYIPGNHDEFARQFLDTAFGGISIKQNAIHTAANGNQFLVLHGDEFDGVIRHAPWLSKIGARLYDSLLRINRYLNMMRSWLGMSYWSLSAYLKGKTKKAVQFVARFEDVVIESARQYDVDGVICGHIHSAEYREADGLIYANSGDWVESCTALVEHMDGRLEIIQWPVTPEDKPQRPSITHTSNTNGSSNGLTEKPSLERSSVMEELFDTATA